DDEHRPVEECDCHPLIPRICKSPERGSQSAESEPTVVMPIYVAGIVDAIGITSSIGSPLNRTVLAMARSSVRLDPARYGVPGSDTRPSSPSSHSMLPIEYFPGAAAAAAIASVTRIVRPVVLARIIDLTVAGGRCGPSTSR